MVIVPRSIRIARRTRRSSSYIAARERATARLRYLDEEVKRLEKIYDLKRKIKALEAKP